MRGPTGASRAALALVAALAVVAVACYDVRPPPVPSAERVPTIVGEIAAWTPSGQGFVLADGQVIDVKDASGAATQTQLGSDSGFPPETNGPRGGLILAGEDALGRFWAATRSPRDDGCFEILGPGYLQLDRDRVLLSSGLVLPLATGFTVKNDRPATATEWLLGADTICLDEAGKVTSIWQEPLGA